MAVFAYVARDPKGARVTGRLEAATEQAAVAELASKGLAPVRVDVAAAAALAKRGRIPPRTVAQTYQQLSDLLRAGVPLLRSLRLLGRGRANPRLSAIMSRVADEVADGERLAEALGKHPQVFPPMQVAMIRAGERGSFLEPVLARLSVFLNHTADLRSKVIGNLIYPVVLLSIGAIIIVLALIFFVPKFRPYFARIQLPLATRFLFACSDLFLVWWPLILVLLVVGAVAVPTFMRRPAIRRRIAEWRIKLPKIGGIVKGLAVARFTRVLGTLLENGIPLIQAMQISRDAAGNELLAEAIDKAIEAVRAGESLAKPLAESGFIEEDVVEMVAVGESANNLATVLVGVADSVEARVDRFLAISIRLMEPLLLLCLAGVVGFIFMALIVPLMQLSSSY